jgi:hypothetical protein
MKSYKWGEETMFRGARGDKARGDKPRGDNVILVVHMKYILQIRILPTSLFQLLPKMIIS